MLRIINHSFTTVLLEFLMRMTFPLAVIGFVIYEISKHWIQSRKPYEELPSSEQKIKYHLPLQHRVTLGVIRFYCILRRMIMN